MEFTEGLAKRSKHQSCTDGPNQNCCLLTMGKAGDEVYLMKLRLNRGESEIKPSSLIPIKVIKYFLGRAIRGK